MSDSKEYMGYEIKKSGDDSFLVVKDEKSLATCLTEYEARGWINRHRRLISNSAKLRNVHADIIKKAPEGKDKEKSNLVLLAGQEEKTAGEKYIKIISRKNRAPEIDVGNLDSNEVLGLMKRAEYLITNHILRNGSI